MKEWTERENTTKIHIVLCQNLNRPKAAKTKPANSAFPIISLGDKPEEELNIFKHFA